MQWQIVTPRVMKGSVVVPWYVIGTVEADTVERAAWVWERQGGASDGKLHITYGLPLDDEELADGPMTPPKGAVVDEILELEGGDGWWRVTGSFVPTRVYWTIGEEQDE